MSHIKRSLSYFNNVTGHWFSGSLSSLFGAGFELYNAINHRLVQRVLIRVVDLRQYREEIGLIHKTGVSLNAKV